MPLPFFMLLAGVASLFLLDPFSYTYLGVCGILALICYFLSRITKSSKLENAAVIGLGAIFTWITLWISTKELPQTYPENPNDPIQSAGFPLKAFDYPHPPMGNDVPPLESWLPFFINLTIWVGIAWILLHLLPKLPEHAQRYLYSALVTGGVIATLMGFGYTLLKFD